MEASTLNPPVGLQRLSVPASLLRLRSDEQLVAGFRGGSEDAFRAIHDRYRARLLAYSRQMLGSSGHDAEDVMQDVFVRAYRALRANDRPVSLRAWLYRIAHNRCIDHLRGPQPSQADVFEVSRTPQPDPPAVVERREDLRRLVTDVSRLPDQQRSALLMRELQGLSYEELASSLEVTVPAVKSLLVRARSGLVTSAEARDTACVSVRRDLALSCDRGVRASGLARRHLRDCSACRDYRDELRGVQRRLGALVPVGPIGVLCQLGGVGGGGAAAGGSVGAGAGVGAGGAILTATKVALVCAAAAVTAGGALGIAPRGLLRALHEPAAGAVHRHVPTARPVGDAGAPISNLATSPAPPLVVAATAAGRAIVSLEHHRRAHHRASARPLVAISPVSGAALVAPTAPVGPDPITGGTSAAGASDAPSGAAAPTGTTGATGSTPSTIVNTTNIPGDTPVAAGQTGGGVTDGSGTPAPAAGSPTASAAPGATAPSTPGSGGSTAEPTPAPTSATDTSGSSAAASTAGAAPSSSAGTATAGAATSS